MPMTPEEKERSDRINRLLEFLAANQAQLSSDVAELRHVTAEHSQQIAENSRQIAAQGSHVQALTDSVLRLARVVDERDRQMEARIHALVEGGAQCDARIKALAEVVDRYFARKKKPQ